MLATPSPQSLKIVAYVREHPGACQSDLARRFGVSRQRVHQILSSRGLTSRDRKRSLRALRRPKVLTRTIYVRCFVCGALVARGRDDLLRTKRTFCGRRCLGAYAGTHYGFGRVGESERRSARTNRRTPKTRPGRGKALGVRSQAVSQYPPRPRIAK